MEDLKIKIEDGGFWIEDRPSRFENSSCHLMPHQHLIQIFLFIHCRESCYFKDFVKL